MNVEGLPDAAARRAIREDLDTTLVVEAAAGTGKTSELVQRLVALLASGKGTAESIVAVTFTEKSAGEMKLRLRAELEAAAQQAQGDRAERLRAAALGLEAARIGTIHGFCHDVLRERPVEAGVDPGFEVLDEPAAKRLFAEVFEAWLERNLATPPEGLRRLLRRAGGRGGGLASSLRRAAYRLVETRDFPCAYRRDAFDRPGALDAVFAALAELSPLAGQADDPKHPLAQALGLIAEHVRRVQRQEQVTARDHDGLEAQLRELLRGKAFRLRGYGRGYGGGLSREEVLERRAAAEARLRDCVERCDADLAACLHVELLPVVQAYEQVKTQAGVLDFLDLLLFTRALLRDHGGVRRELNARFSHVFVDEFQDTDPVQTEIVLLLASADPAVAEPWNAPTAPGKLFVVGDPKQSIYRFRRAEQRFYARIKQHLVSRGAHVQQLTTSFRSLPAIQSLVNATFAPRMAGGSGPPHAGGEPLHPGYVPLTRYRKARSDQPAVVALPVPEPYGRYGKISGYAIDASLPAAVGAYVQWLVADSGWTVREGDREVPIQPRHVCLLFRRTSAYGRDIVQPYVRALSARRLHVARGGGRSFYHREEIQALRTALEAIEWPDDALSVYATLRGPLFALGDDLLLRLRTARGSLHPLAPLDPVSLPEELAAAAQALSLLGRLHRQRNRHPVHHTLRALLSATRAHAAIAIWPTGEQALGNVLRLCDLARRYESLDRASSFRGFLDWLDVQAEEGQGEEAAVAEQGDEGVRISTVHAAKGLEFPVVILCDPTAPLRPERPSRYVDEERGLWAQAIMGLAPAELNAHAAQVLLEDEAEEVRLAYVAATRACDLLVIPVVGDRDPARPPDSGWVDLFGPALFPPHEARREAAAAPGCPPFGVDSVLSRPHDARFGTRASVAPGQHRPERGEHQVVFWDPQSLSLSARAIGGLRQQELLKPDDGAGVAGERTRLYHAWRDAWGTARQAATRPSVVAAPVTALAQALSQPEVATAGSSRPSHDRQPRQVDVERLEREPQRPSGARFGSLVHGLLEHVRPGDDAARVRALAGSLSRQLGAPEAEQDAAVRVLERALAHPLLQRAFAAEARGELWREAPLTARSAEGDVMEGVVDLVFREQGVWWVVDYKTDAVAQPSERYRWQLTLYAETLEAVTAEPVRCVLWLV